jgi:drug/metabolite transporter (DMT)-like permease
MQSRSSAALAIALLVVLIWGVNFSMLKSIMGQISPGAVLFARFLASPVCALILLLSLFGRRWPRLSRSDWWQLIGLALLGQMLHVGLMMHGVSLSTAFASALISACGPLFTLFTVRLLEPYRFGRMQLLGVAMALIGVLVFLSDRLAGPLSHSWGDLVLLIATALFSVYSVIARPMIARHGAVVVSAYGMLLASPPMLAIYWAAGSAAPWSTLSATTWTMLVWSLVVSAFAGWLVWSWINKVRGVARSAPLLYLLPPVAGVTAWLWLGEALTTAQLAGAALALAGVAAAQFGRREGAMKDISS